MGSNLTNNPEIAALSGQLSDIQAACLMAMQKADDLGTEIKELEARSAYLDASMAEGQRLAYETLRSAELRVANINAARDRLIMPQRQLIARIEEEIDELSEILISLTGDTGENETDKSQISADNIEFLASLTYKTVLREKYDYRSLPAPIEQQDKTAAVEMEAAMPAADFAAGPEELPEDIMAAAYDAIATINVEPNRGEEAGTEIEQQEETIMAADETEPAAETELELLEETLLAADETGPAAEPELELQEKTMLAAYETEPAAEPELELLEETILAADETGPTAEPELELLEETLLAAYETGPAAEPELELLEETLLAADETGPAEEQELELLEETILAADETEPAAETELELLEETILAADETGPAAEPELELQEETKNIADEIGPAAEPEIEMHEQAVAPASEAASADRASLPLRMSAVTADKKVEARSSRPAAKRSLPQRLHKLVLDEVPPHTEDTGTVQETAADVTTPARETAAAVTAPAQEKADNVAAPAQKTAAAATAPAAETAAAATAPVQETAADVTAPAQEKADNANAPAQEKEPAKAAALPQEPEAGETTAVPELHLTAINDSDPSLLGLEMPVQFSFYAGEDRQPQALRCHEWLIKMIIKIPEDNFQFVPDGDGARDIQSILLRYNQAVLNDMYPFDIVTPSRPNIGMYFYNCLEDNLSTMHLLLREISIWENNSQLLKVTYRNKVLDELLNRTGN